MIGGLDQDKNFTSVGWKTPKAYFVI